MSKVITLLGSTGSIGTQSLTSAVCTAMGVFACRPIPALTSCWPRLPSSTRRTLPSPTRQPLKAVRRAGRAGKRTEAAERRGRPPGLA